MASAGHLLGAGQPGWAAPVRGDGLGLGVQLLLLPVSGALIDVATGRLWVSNGNARSMAAAKAGRAVTFDGNGDYYSHTGYPELVGNVGTFFAWLPRINGFDTNGSVLFGTNTTASSFFQVSNTSTFVFGADTGSGSAVSNTLDTSLVFSSDGTAAGKRFFVNGALFNSGGASAPVAFAAGPKSFQFGAWIGGALWDCNMECVVAGFTTRTWSHAEARAFHINPWQLFAPDPIEVYWPTASGPAEGSGSVAGVGAMVGAGSHTASGSGSVVGVGAPVGAGLAVKSGSGSVTGVGLLVGEGEAPSSVPSGGGSVSGVGLLVGQGGAVASGSGSVVGVGLLAGGGGTATGLELGAGGGRRRRPDHLIRRRPEEERPERFAQPAPVATSVSPQETGAGRHPEDAGKAAAAFIEAVKASAARVPTKPGLIVDAPTVARNDADSTDAAQTIAFSPYEQSTVAAMSRKQADDGLLAAIAALI